MKTTIYHLALLLVGVACTVEVSTESDSSQLNQTIDEFNKAFEMCDIQTLDRLTTEPYVHSNGNNPAITKKEWMAYLKKRKAQLDGGQLKVTKYALSEKKVTLHDQSAIVTGLIEMAGMLDSLSFSRKIRVSNFWIKENNQWKRAGFHDTRME
ncbi:MAG: nuclear transport factor 2 family protein [Reichenbachiella sp.]|uniref:nuclear transport factor 2 family protein n=1 Tax=Reichenbachiella sp. TaxID=2184521 RepID=UPI00326536F9